MLLAEQVPTPYNYVCYRDALVIPLYLFHLQAVHLKHVAL